MNTLSRSSLATVLLLTGICSIMLLADSPVVHAKQDAAKPLPPAFADRCLEVAEQLDPQFAAELRALCDLDPAEFERVIRRQGPRLTGLAELQSSDPVLYQKKLIELKADAEVHRLAGELQQLIEKDPANTDRIESLKKLLRGQLRIRLGFELHNQQLYIERIEEQLESLRARSACEREHFDEVVEAQLARITGQSEPIQSVCP
ncbi:MAG: hypothetical protein CMJ36_05375 [Phycisphaerae bacterium]|nr:hypothetical protein [Phycisphaerae bacterium]